MVSACHPHIEVLRQECTGLNVGPLLGDEGLPLLTPFGAGPAPRFGVVGVGLGRSGPFKEQDRARIGRLKPVEGALSVGHEEVRFRVTGSGHEQELRGATFGHGRGE